MPLKQVAGVSTPDSRTLLITRVGQRASFPRSERPIEKSDLGLTPNIDGTSIRLAIPPLNEERRKDLAKLIKKKAEDGTDRVRNVRHKAHDEIKGQLKSARDHRRRQQAHARVAAKADRQVVKEIDALVAAKEKEIMEV